MSEAARSHSPTAGGESPLLEREPVSLGSRDPDEFNEWIGGSSSSVCMEATARRGFRVRARGRPLYDCALMSLRVDHGRARFPAGRATCGLTVPLHSGFEATVRGKLRAFGPGSVHRMNEDDQVVRPFPGSHLLGVSIDATLLAAQQEAYATRYGEDLRPSHQVVRTGTPEGRRFLRYLDRVWSQVVQPSSPLHRPRVAREVADTIARLLVEAQADPDLPEAVAADRSRAKRAEEILSAQLDRPVSLAEIARSVDTSTRSLNRAFQKRHGMGAVAFLRRRRLEAARRDLIDGEESALRVTDVALRYGFDHLGRFSIDYRRLFGESPSTTLRA